MTSIKHIVFTAAPAWGHNRPFCILGARLVKEDAHIVVTLLISPNLLKQAEREISAELQSEGLEVHSKRIRVLSTFQTNSNDIFELFGPLAQTYGPAYETLVQGKSITCAMRGTVFDPVPAPAVVILDFFTYIQCQATRAITGHSVPILAWITGHASSIIRQFGPESLGGIGDLGAKIDIAAAQAGVSPEEIGDKVFAHTDGTLVKISGLPPMYDYEFFPQEPPFGISISPILRNCYKCIEECDGAVLSSARTFEKESLEEFDTWFSDLKKDLFVIGPLLPSGFGSTTQYTEDAGETGDFLDRTLLDRGEKSVFFISFGTAFFPPVVEYLEEVLEALIEKDIPFVFSIASPFAKLSTILVEKIRSSGLGLLTKWAPQQYILSHPATGWFLSHGGQNSVIESLACGIPFIIWPFQADQPGAAAHLTENLHVAFELIEIRTGEHARKPLYRNGRAASGTREAVAIEIREVLDACRGPEGMQMRKNAEAIRKEFAEAWEEDGVSRKELRAFLKKYV